MASFGGPDLIKNGLVLSLDAGNIKSYSGSGTVWSDLSGNNVSGSLINGPTFNTDGGGSILFDGTDDYLAFSNSRVAPGTGPFTWNFWARLNNISTFSILFSGEGSNTSYGVIGMNPSSPGLTYYALGYQITDGAAFGTDWTFISFVGNGAADGSRNLKLYRNGIQAGSTYTANYNFTSTTPYIGRNHSYSPENMKGYVSNVNYYDRELSAQEIQQNFIANRKRFGL